MDTRFKAAIVGLGKIAWKMGRNPSAGDSLSHAAAYQANPRTSLVAGCSPDISENHAFHQEYGLPVYESIDQMLEEQRPDIISVCSPTEFHFEQVTSLIKNHVPMIWLEKPPVENVNQLKKLISMANESRKSTILVNYQRRYSTCYQNLRDVIRNSNFGSIRIIEVRYSKGLLVNGSHMLDQIFYLLGNIEYEIAWVDLVDNGQNPSFVLKNLDGNISIIVSACDLPYHNLDIIVTCDKARLSILHGGMTTRLEPACEHELFPGYYRLCETDENILGKGGFEFSYDKALSDLLAAHQNDSLPDSNLESALQAQILMDKVLGSKQQ